MAEARHWLPVAANSSADTSGDRDRIGMRRHPRTKGRPVGVSTPRQPFSIGVAHLDWHDDADCRYVDPELFFPEGSPDSRAIAICNSCPVQQTCLDDALADPHRMGIWGGTTNADRDRMRGEGRAVKAAEYRAAKKAAAAKKTA